MLHSEDCVQIRLKERENASPGERVRAVGMCFYGTGEDLVKVRRYTLERNPANVKDPMCIEVKQRGQVRASLNASISLLLAPLGNYMVISIQRIFIAMDKKVANLELNHPLIYKCYFYSLMQEDAKWSRGDSGRPAKAHKIEIECMVKATDLQLLKEKMKCFVVTLSL